MRKTILLAGCALLLGTTVIAGDFAADPLDFRNPQQDLFDNLSEMLRETKELQSCEKQQEEALQRFLKAGISLNAAAERTRDYAFAAAATKLIRAEVRNEVASRRDRLIALGRELREGVTFVRSQPWLWATLVAASLHSFAVRGWHALAAEWGLALDQQGATALTGGSRAREAGCFIQPTVLVKSASKTLL